MIGKFKTIKELEKEIREFNFGTDKRTITKNKMLPQEEWFFKKKLLEQLEQIYEMIEDSQSDVARQTSEQSMGWHNALEDLKLRLSDGGRS